MSTIEIVEYECPFCNEKFNYRKQFSYTIFGRNLDFKPVGAAVIPTPIPKCPKCNFVFFEKMFSKEEIKKLRELLVNNDIFKLEPNMSNYYYLAKEYELLNKSIDKIISCYHSTIWENSNKNNNKEVFIKIANIIMEYYEKVGKEDDNYYIYKLIKIDFLRRLNEFEKAVELIETLKKDNDFPHDQFGKVLEYQLDLIIKNDTEEHEMPLEVEYECPLCNEIFNYIKQVSDSIFGINLDFKPLGSGITPTPIPKCPKCNFVSSEEILSKEEIKKLRELLANNDIFELEPNMPKYYYLAKECELLNKSLDEIISCYHSAIWENSNKNNNKEVFIKIANIIMEYYEKVGKEDDNYYIYKLIKIDFLRRLNEFEKAIELIETLKKNNDFPHDKFGKILKYQLDLIIKNDTEEHKMPY
jgi:hypothetical protein